MRPGKFFILNIKTQNNWDLAVINKVHKYIDLNEMDSNPTRRLHATCSELPRNHIISKLHVVFNGCAEVPSKLREVFLLGKTNINKND